MQLADGTRALTAAGRWHDAEAQLRRHNGIGRRMLDGRQVAIIACATRGEHTQAQRLLADTEAGDAWEAAVTACLAALARPAVDPLPAARREAMIGRYRHVQPTATLVVFRTRLALSAIDAAGGTDHRLVEDIARDLVGSVLDLGDGYAARDLLAHEACRTVGTAEQAEALDSVVDQSGLGRPLPAAAASALEAALAISEAVITRGVPARAA